MSRTNRLAPIAIALIGALFFAACGKAPSAASKAFLTINVEQTSTWVRNFNPFSPSARNPAGNGVIYEPMMIFNKSTSALVPWLATGYAWNADNTELTFTLRDGVKWSDGQAFTAQDVVFTLDLLKSHPDLLNNIGPGVLDDTLAGWSTPDDRTVKFTFKVVNTEALYILADQLIVPKHIWKDVADPAQWTNENPVGTGPFTEVTKFESQIFVIEKNPNYWQAGKPAFQGIRYPAYADNDAANLALINGDLDWVGNFVPDAQKTFVSKNADTNHYYIVGGDALMLYVNPAIKPLDDPIVRKAISMAIDRKRVINVAIYDYVPPLDATGLSDEFKSWKKPDTTALAIWTNYDIAAANKMLDDAGYAKGADGIRVGPDGKPMTYTLWTPSGWSDWNSAAQIISTSVKDIGINIVNETPEESAWQDQVFAGNFQMAIGWTSGGATPYNMYRGLMSSQTVLPVGEPANENWARYADPAIDPLLADFVKTSDPNQQKEIMDKIIRLFLKDAPAIPLWPAPDWDGFVTTRFTGFPDASNPYAPGCPYNSPTISLNQLIVLTTITPK